jgi:hypothetical protein
MQHDPSIFKINPEVFESLFSSGRQLVPNAAPLKKLSDELRPCRHPSHDPPSHIVLDPGTYRHTCSGCGASQVFSVAGVHL